MSPNLCFQRLDTKTDINVKIKTKTPVVVIISYCFISRDYARVSKQRDYTVQGKFNKTYSNAYTYIINVRH